MYVRLYICVSRHHSEILEPNMLKFGMHSPRNVKEGEKHKTTELSNIPVLLGQSPLDLSCSGAKAIIL